MYPDYVSFDEVKAGVDQSIIQSLEDLTNAYGLWELDVNDIFKLAGTTIDDFGTKTMPDLYKNVSKETEKIVKNVDKTKTDMTNDFKEIITFLGTWYDDYKKPIDDTTLENEELAFSIETLIQDYINLDK
jgi:phage-related tail protein